MSHCGGKDRFCPLPPCRISSIAEKCSRYRHETLITFSSINLTSTITVRKKNPSRKFWESRILVTPFLPLVKNCNCLKAFKMFRFEKIHNQKATKDVKLTTPQAAVSVFEVFILTHKAKMTNFHKCFINPKLLNYETGKCVINLQKTTSTKNFKVMS